MASTVRAPVRICGGLPVIAEVFFDQDYWGEHDATVEAIYWMKKDGTAGSQVSQKVYDRAEKYDCQFSSLVDQVNDWCAMQEPEESNEENTFVLAAFPS